MRRMPQRTEYFICWLKATLTLSSTVRFLNSRMFWKVRAMPGRDHLVGLFADHRLAVEVDCALGGLVDAGEQVEDGGFAGAVRADQADELVLADFRVEVGDRLEPAEGDAQMLGLEYGFAHDSPPPLTPPAAAGSLPVRRAASPRGKIHTGRAVPRVERS